VLAAGGSVWVSNSEDGTVSRIDPSSAKVTATIEVCKAPEGLALAEGSVWVVCEESDAVGRIDPATDTMVDT
jgi:YVTN family beta-propeller protein